MVSMTMAGKRLFAKISLKLPNTIVIAVSNVSRGAARIPIGRHIPKVATTVGRVKN
nr:hypothetical protein [Olavius algarvensis spirochete endosymbiont]